MIFFYFILTINTCRSDKPSDRQSKVEPTLRVQTLSRCWDAPQVPSGSSDSRSARCSRLTWETKEKIWGDVGTNMCVFFGEIAHWQPKWLSDTNHFLIPHQRSSNQSSNSNFMRTTTRLFPAPWDLKVSLSNTDLRVACTCFAHVHHIVHSDRHLIKEMNALLKSSGQRDSLTDEEMSEQRDARLCPLPQPVTPLLLTSTVWGLISKDVCSLGRLGWVEHNSDATQVAVLQRTMYCNYSLAGCCNFLHCCYYCEVAEFFSCGFENIFDRVNNRITKLNSHLLGHRNRKQFRKDRNSNVTRQIISKMTEERTDENLKLVCESFITMGTDFLKVQFNIMGNADCHEWVFKEDLKNARHKWVRMEFGWE